MRKATLVAIAITIAASGITHAKKAEWSLKGASRTESMVTLTFISKEPELSIEDRSNAESAAMKQCSVWGHNHAELNGEIQRACNGRSRFGKCKRWEFTMPLQCTTNAPTN